MTLQSAYHSGKKFRLGTTGAYVAAADFRTGNFSVDQLLSNDWVVEPAGKTLTAEQVAAAWDSIRAEFTAVKPSATSPVFQRLVSKLFEIGG